MLQLTMNEIAKPWRGITDEDSAKYNNQVTAK